MKYNNILIKNKIKNINNTFLIFSPNKKIFLKIEKLLLDNGYTWRPFNTSNPLNVSQYGDNYLSDILIYINFNNNEPKKLSLLKNPNNNLINQCDIILNEENINYWVNTLFSNIPNYNCKNKIIRSL